MSNETSIKLTYADYVLLPDDGRRHEIIDGEHFVTPSPVTKHQRVSLRLAFLLEQFVREKGLGSVFAAPLDVVLSDTDVVEPDLLYISNERSHLIKEENIQGAPDLVVEILSEWTRKTDEVIKRKLYERYGVGEYWVIDPLLETVKVYRRSGERFERVAEASAEAGDRLVSPLFPGLEISLAEIFG